MLSRGLKLKIRQNEVEEDLKIKENRDCLKTLLSLERIAPHKCRAHGIYESENNRILVTKVEGKWTYGYSENNLKYLEPFEALYLIEMVSFFCNQILLNNNYVFSRIVWRLSLIL